MAISMLHRLTILLAGLLATAVATASNGGLQAVFCPTGDTHVESHWNDSRQFRHPLDESQACRVYDRTIYRFAVDRSNLYIRISKSKQTLYVYEQRGFQTVLIAAYPVCLGVNKGNKTRIGDHRTPESIDDKPFTICQIQNASSWYHDFGDGRGPMPAYGQWFMRLSGDYPGTSIGIHGSTGNRYSVPGRGSEGCIRLRDEDIIHLKEHYAFVGMKVFIDREEQ